MSATTRPGPEAMCTVIVSADLPVPCRTWAVDQSNMLNIAAGQPMVRHCWVFRIPYSVFRIPFCSRVDWLVVDMQNGETEHARNPV